MLQKQTTKMIGRKLLFLVILGYLSFPASAQIDISVQNFREPSSINQLLTNFHRFHPKSGINTSVKKNHSIMLSSPSMDHYAPLFCRLEDKINDGNKIQCLFRLGSVSYVNYLEQKGDHQRLLLEQLR